MRMRMTRDLAMALYACEKIARGQNPGAIRSRRPIIVCSESRSTLTAFATNLWMYVPKQGR